MIELKGLFNDVNKTNCSTKKSKKWEKNWTYAFETQHTVKLKKIDYAINHIVDWNENWPESLQFIQQFENNRVFWSVSLHISICIREVNAMPFSKYSQFIGSIGINEWSGEKKCLKTGGNQSIWLALSQQYWPLHLRWRSIKSGRNFATIS